MKINLAFTAKYNLVVLLLAALGILPPILVAAAQSLPDLGILLTRRGCCGSADL
ncbi:MAG: hypothetical protein KJ077_00940 [Anaerolineae bacterium]|nr:hypothetical protein [Anaerolineae bacterium]